MQVRFVACHSPGGARIHTIVFISLSAAQCNLQADWAAQGIVRRCPVCLRDSVVGHGRRQKQAHDEHHDWIANELITNAFQHAFPEDRGGHITVSLARLASSAVEQLDTRASLRVEDNGIGFPTGYDVGTATTMGIRIVHLLAEQITAAGGSRRRRTGYSDRRVGGELLVGGLCRCRLAQLQAGLIRFRHRRSGLHRSG